MRLYVIARHGESTLNFENRINGDPSVPVALTEKGRAEARLLGEQLAHVRLDLCVHTRFARTLETAEIIERAGGVVTSWEGGDPRELVETRGMKQVTDLSAIEKLVEDGHPVPVAIAVEVDFHLY